MTGAYYTVQQHGGNVSQPLHCVGIHNNGVHLVLMSKESFPGYYGKRMSLPTYNSMKEKLSRSLTTSRFWGYVHPSNATLCGVSVGEEHLGTLSKELEEMGTYAKLLNEDANKLTLPT